MRWIIWSVILAAPVAVYCTSRAAQVKNGNQDEPHRSPIDLVLVGDSRALTANQTADSVSLVDLKAGQVLAEVKVGQKPAAVAVAADGTRAAVSNNWSADVTLLEVGAASLRAAGRIAVGPLPQKLVFSPDGQKLYVAVSGADEVAEIDLAAARVVHRWPAFREPWGLALSADGQWLVAACTRSSHVRCWNTKTRQLHWERRLWDAFNLRGLTFAPDGGHVIVGHCYRRDLPVSKNNIEEGWVIDNRMSRVPIAQEVFPPYYQMALDLRGEAVADPHGVAFTADAATMVVSAAGSHELVLLPLNRIPWSPGEPGDFIDVSLEVGPHKLRRVPVGGRPTAVAVAAGQAIVANYLLDSVQVVDLAAAKLERSIHLGGPRQPSRARQGEALFYDAQRSTAQWFSCHTCHADGHTSGMHFDTLNDGGYGNAKQTLSLRNVALTAPYTWHGWQDDLSAAIRKSFTDTMFGPAPTDAEVQAVAAFLATLQNPPNPHRGQDGQLSPAAQRGQEIFLGKARCDRCHKGDLYHSTTNYDVKLELDGSPYSLWNPPSLRGVWNRGPYLHDGRAQTLDELLRGPHSSEKLNGAKLTDQERKDLVEFLKSL